MGEVKAEADALRRTADQCWVRPTLQQPYA
jgi:hypothetical protein